MPGWWMPAGQLKILRRTPTGKNEMGYNRGIHLE